MCVTVCVHASCISFNKYIYFTNREDSNTHIVQICDADRVMEMKSLSQRLSSIHMYVCIYYIDIYNNIVVLECIYGS